ncbi:FHA domain-containing protein [Salinibacterium sp. dk2585]|uniref:FHA domain-containing protein n=1 Tax=unclassified Salinibacterium TaxID=2632331 RepID=UPI0011C25065|nr:MULTISPECIES: FHA domain-containing protein [unclassified Salinibacterium]QEE60596.1 FHA domain-containing protein [Salinibacterium sp. dk2585]TXK55668.1 FHA domain-containing protein [Salinibacterium sp. dk5596]
MYSPVVVAVLTAAVVLCAAAAAVMLSVGVASGTTAWLLVRWRRSEGGSALPASVEITVTEPHPFEPSAPARATTAAASVWKLETAQGQRIELTERTVIVGRNPVLPAGVERAQLVPLRDSDLSVSKTHARLDLIDGTWVVTDLFSTNGVRLAASERFTGDNRLDAGVPSYAEAHVTFGELAARIRLERRESAEASGAF